jgi:hypothetical protein
MDSYPAQRRTFKDLGLEIGLSSLKPPFQLLVSQTLLIAAIKQPMCVSGPYLGQSGDFHYSKVDTPQVTGTSRTENRSIVLASIKLDPEARSSSSDGDQSMRETPDPNPVFWVFIM